MAGLLDYFDSPNAQLGLGLLAAAAPRSDGAGFGQRLMEGVQSAQGMRQQKQKDAYMQTLMDAKKSEIDQQRLKAQQEQMAIDLEAKKRSALPNIFQSASVGAPALNVDSILPPEMRTGLPSQPAVQPRQASINVPYALANGYNADELMKLDGLRHIGMDEVARTQDVEGPNGSKLVRQLTKWGQQAAPDMNGYVAPVSVNQGDRTTFVKPAAGVSLPMNMSFADRNSAGNLALSRERLNFDKAGGAEAVKAAKPEWRDGQWVAAPRDMQPGEARAVSTSASARDANEALALIETAKKIIPKSTGSYIGAGLDQAARAFGTSTGGDTAAAQLKALEGALVSKMPKMSGPQSDKDVLLYKQMAGEIGDPTIPGDRKLAALKVIEEIQQRHAGAKPAATKPLLNVPAGNLGSGTFKIISVE